MCVDICNSVENNTLVVNAASLEAAASLERSIQDVVECLRDGGSIVFAENYAANSTLTRKRNLYITSISDAALTCNGKSILRIA